jgi:hypothetical protein
MYILQVLSSDEQTQKYGCVMVFYGGLATGETSFLKETNLKGTMNNLFAAFPIRISAIHICFPDTPVYQIGAAALMLFSPSIMRVRVRKHMGAYYCIICIVFYRRRDIVIIIIIIIAIVVI